jgi:hypothetical protein
VLTVLHRNRPCLHGIVLVALLCWLALLVSATCTMPLRTSPAVMAGCPEQRTPHQDHIPKTDCSFKPCLDSRSGPGVAAGEQPPKLPLIALWVVWLAAGWLSPIRHLRIPRPPDPPSGRWVPLIYRFCVLLN